MARSGEQGKRAATRYIALLRGVNVGGNNKIPMAGLKAAFIERGFGNVSTYINSGNVIFDSGLEEAAVQAACESLIESGFGMKIAVGIITAAELNEALASAPGWWDNDPGAKHNAIFVIPPADAAEISEQMGETNPDYEKASVHGKVIFWSARLAEFSRTRWSKLAQSKAVNSAVTIRNANTAKKLAALACQEIFSRGT